MISRREWMALTGGAILSSALPARWAMAQQQEERVIPDYEKPMFDIPGQIKDPVIIQTIELLKRGNNFFVRTTSKDGAVGLSPTKQVEEFLPILQRSVAPFFRNKDARQIETLIDGAYINNYKNAGLALNCPIAYVEQSVLDLLGKVAKKPIGALLGGVIRKEVAVYLSGSDRVLSAEEEVAVYERGVPETGAKAVKFKI